jgi:ABC-type branched-subunit amino acid transport system substrate-binding protein
MASAGIMAATALSPFRSARADELGVTSSKIIFGQSAPLEGPASELGMGMMSGILAAFAEVNRAGGVMGRQLDLVSADDGYEPSRTSDVTKNLLEVQKVFGLIGFVGTPTSAAVLPMVEASRVPFIGAFTGAEALRSPFRSNVINIRASYYQETEAMVDQLTKSGAKKIAVVYQDDAFGRAGLDGAKAAMGRRSLSLVSEATYVRNTIAVRSAVLQIQRANPDAVILVGAYKPCAEFIKLSKQLRIKANFVNISFVGSEALASELGRAGEGVVITQVVPLPTGEESPLVKKYIASLGLIGRDLKPSLVSLEGYIAGRFAAATLGKVSGDLTRAAFVDAAYKTASFDIDGFKLQYGADDNQGSDAVYLTAIGADGALRTINRIEPVSP